MPKVIHLHSIRVTSRTDPHDDLPSDMKMFAQLIIEEKIVLQTLPVASEHNQMRWNLIFGCSISSYDVRFSVAILRQSESEGTRLLGYVKIGRGEVLGSVELNSGTLQLKLRKLNPDAPSLKLNAGFSVSGLSNQEVLGLDLIGMPDNTITSVKKHGIRRKLQEMYENSKKPQFSMDVPELLVMHERILLCCQSNENRAQWLNVLGDICLQAYQESGTVAHLNQAVCAYNDAVRDDPGSGIYLVDLAISLGYRFRQLGRLLDLNRSIVMFEAAISLTPDGHLDKPRMLNNLGMSLCSRFSRLDDLIDLNLSVSTLETAVTLTPDGDLNKASMLSNLGTSLCSRFERLGDLGDLNRSVLRHEGAIILTPDGHPDKPSRFDNLGSSLISRFKRLGDLNDINQAVVMFEAAVNLTPDGHPDKPSRLVNLGGSLVSRFECLGYLNDINQAVMMFEAAITLTPDGHPRMPSRLSNLGSSLHIRFSRLGDLGDLNQSVLNLEAAVSLTPDGHPNKPQQLSNLGSLLRSCFERLGDLDDLNHSVFRLEAAVTLTPDGHPDKPSMLSNLGMSFRSRFLRLGDLDDLNQAVLSLETAVTLTPDGHQDKVLMLSNLGSSLASRFERLGDSDDINQAVSRLGAAVTLTPDGHPEKPPRLNNLGISLRKRFEQLSDPDDLNQSISRLEAAVTLTPDGHAGMPSWLNSFGGSLITRFKRFGDLDDINQAVFTLEAAVTLTPNGHAGLPLHLSNLGDSLRIRFSRLGDLRDLNQAVSRLEAAVTLTSDGHPQKLSRLNNLGIALRTCFERLGYLDDLRQSIFRLEAAVTLAPDGHPDKPSMLSNLGSSLVTRFERLGDLDDLNQSVLRIEAALSLTLDGHPDKSSRLTNLGSSLIRRFERLRDLDDLNQAVLRHQAAVSLIPDGHPDKPSWLNNLGSSLIRRFEQLDDLDDLNQAVLGLKAALTLTPEGHPDKPLMQINFGNLLQQRFERLHDPQDSQQLLHLLTSAACSETGPAIIRFQAARRWAEHAHIHQHSSLLHSYTTAIRLLPELAWLGLSITDRHHQLSEAGQVVRDATSAAIAVQDYQKAVEWLDQGCSVIWGQLLNLRTPVDELRKSHPYLADQLVSLSTSLENAGTRGNAVSDSIQPQSLRSMAQRSHALALERNHTLQQIRELPGFRRFLLPKPFSELSLAANMGPVAILNISAYGCDALILMPGLADEVIHVPLSDFTLLEAQVLAKHLASIVGTPGRSDRLFGFQEGHMAPDDIFSMILSQLWLKIVRPILNALAITTPVCKGLGRIWWCPTGPLAFLPIHAAGLYGENQAFGSKLSDFLISSYTPSLTALIQGFLPRSEFQEQLQLLAVTQPSADGQDYIPGTQEEIKGIQQHVKGKHVHLQWLDEEMATIDNVQKGMRNSRWVHFACHGVQSDSPTESALLIAGSSRLTLSNIIKLSLPNVELAFLSACQTATGSQALQDESVYLTAGMLLAGYRGVIGTMWTIRDDDAPQVAGDFYAHLLEISPPDSTKAAEALHLAVQKLRERPGAKFIHWVPFIHFGV
ncbi:TPR-like protein [Mycena rebaudengoi]|nr:TPR-like protein [Mycena rebaudengoi]